MMSRAPSTSAWTTHDIGATLAYHGHFVRLLWQLKHARTASSRVRGESHCGSWTVAGFACVRPYGMICITAKTPAIQTNAIRNPLSHRRAEAFMPPRMPERGCLTRVTLPQVRPAWLAAQRLDACCARSTQGNARCTRGSSGRSSILRGTDGAREPAGPARLRGDAPRRGCSRELPPTRSTSLRTVAPKPPWTARRDVVASHVRSPGAHDGKTR